MSYRALPGWGPGDQPGHQMHEFPSKFSATAYVAPMPSDPLDATYTTVSQYEQHSEAPLHVERPPPDRRKRSFINQLSFLLSILLGLAWLLPICYLLFVNISGRTIGAAAWCRSEATCNVISYLDITGTTVVQKSMKYDRDNHDLLGGLQFVAKILELWFVYIATSLMWQLTVLLARRSSGIPIGYMATHLGFADPRLLLDPILYRAAGGQKRQSPYTPYAKHLRLFILCAVLMCILANLMGPSVAVLVLPQLGWRNQTITPTGQFQQLLSATAPAGDAIPGCSAASLEAGDYTCANISYAMAVENLATAYNNEMRQNLQVYPEMYADLSVLQNPSNYFSYGTAGGLEGLIPFPFNLTMPKDPKTSTGMLWAPSRQTLRGLSSDFEDVYGMISGTTQNRSILDRYAQHNSSLELVIQRYGPIIGFEPYAFSGPSRSIFVAENKQIRCYQITAPVARTKCMRTGTGWNATDEVQYFTMDRNQTFGSEILVGVYWSDKAIELEDPNDPCFSVLTSPEEQSCDYETMFNQGGPTSASEPLDRMHDMLVVDMGFNSDVSVSSFVLEIFPGVGFGTYSLDITHVRPSLKPAEMRDTPDISSLTPVALHPAWFLAAWNVANNTDISPGRSDATLMLQESLIGLFTYPPPSNYVYAEALIALNSLAAAHGASMVPYTTTPAPAKTDNLPALQPLLWSNVYNKVWGWSLDSRTAKLGVVVACLGVLTVVVRTALLFITRAEEDSALQLITSALKHQYTGELDRSVSGLDNARVRYRLLGGTGAGEVSFVHVG